MRGTDFMNLFDSQTRAWGVSCALYNIVVILFVGAWSNVSRIAARRVIALVGAKQSFGYGADGQLVGHTVCQNKGSVRQPKNTVVGFVPESSPRPARIWPPRLINLRPEARHHSRFCTNSSEFPGTFLGTETTVSTVNSIGFNAKRNSTGFANSLNVFFSSCRRTFTRAITCLTNFNQTRLGNEMFSTDLARAVYSFLTAFPRAEVSVTSGNDGRFNVEGGTAGLAGTFDRHGSLPREKRSRRMGCAALPSGRGFGWPYPSRAWIL
jgi:hypothetical protein